MSGIAPTRGWLGSWPWRARRRVRMAFPCPACLRPLLAMVEPELELECPDCRTTFVVPAPPAPIINIPKAPPIPGVQANPVSEGFLGKAPFVLGLISLVVGTIVSCGFALFIFIGIFVTGTIVARIRNGFRRRKNPLLPKLTWSQIGYEGIRAIGITVMGSLAAGLGAGMFMGAVQLFFG